ncbi:MAG: TatD family hydrolase [Ignavibacteria bacterium]|nr:TatD family hydrolase [Ignavibacteria bacterium]
MITDTHAHLYFPECISIIDEILSRARDSGIRRIIVPAVDLETSKVAIELSEKYEMIYCAVGIHPGDVNKAEINVIDELNKLLEREKVVAVGETGLDYYWDTSNIEKQKSFFKIQIELAKSHKLPVIIHTRNSVDDAVEMIKENYDKDLRGQFHCFSGNKIQLNAILSMDNFYVSYCGNITYKNYADIDVIKKTPQERLLSETDSPFLPPVPYRGKKNEPSYIIHTLDKISEIKGANTDELLKSINKNVESLFFDFLPTKRNTDNAD